MIITSLRPPDFWISKAMTRIGLIALTLIATGALSGVMASSSLAANTTTCKSFEEDNAFCNKPLTAGVGIEAENGTVCTAGPLVLPKAAAKRAETYLLTAGHCIKKGGGASKAWFAKTPSGVKMEIGKSGPFIVADEGDVGVIKINDPGAWALTTKPTLYAVMVKWGTLGKEITSTPVTGEEVPVLSHTNCHEGQTTGERCGTIISVTASTEVEETKIEHLVEDVKAESDVGDSGGPWYSTEPHPGLLLEGIHINNNGGNHAIYEPLGTAFGILNKKEGLNLELLTTANEVRNKLIKSGPLVVEGGGATLECTSVEGVSNVSPGGEEMTEGSTLAFIAQKWNGCTVKTSVAKGIKPSVKECLLQFEGINKTSKTAKAALVNECTIEVKVLGTCIISLPGGQKGLEKNFLENSGENLLVEAEDSGITAEPKGSCLGVSKTTNGKMKATLTAVGLKVV